MSYLIFARKWRPQDFDEIVGQAHVATTLKNAIKLNRVAQAYLFTGPRGVGKTSTARIFAKALNCQEGPTPNPCNKCVNCAEITHANSLDVIEIDGASNRGIDEIRNLRENIKLSPIHGKFKIYVIDEVHQITEAAFNALLKTLEEPPPHVKFIFATTQPHKIPSTILSRCQRFDFKRIPAAEIVEKLKAIASSEKIDAPEGVFFEIARASDGSLRDAESILDQLNSFCETRIGLEDVIKVLGIIEDSLLLDLTALLAKKDTAAILKMIDDLTNDGRDLFQFALRLIEHIRNLAVIKINKKALASAGIPDDAAATLAAQGESFSLEDLMYFFYLLSASYETARKTGFIRFSLEFALIKMVRREGIVPINELLDKIKTLKQEERPIPAPAAASGGRGTPSDIASSVAGALSTASETGTEPGEKRPGTNETPSGAQGPGAVPGPAALSGDMNDVLPEVSKRLLEKKASLASFLMEGDAAAAGEGIIKISFPKIYQFHKEILEKPDNKKLVEGIFADVLARKIKIEFVLAANMERKNHKKIPEEETKSAAVEKENQDPALRSALEVFKGSVIRNSSNNNPKN